MKKIKILLMIAICTIIVGCGCEKDKKQKDDDSNKKTEDVVLIENTIKDLYSDEDKLVYNNNDVYKIVIFYEGENVTLLQHYYEYSDEESAKEDYKEKFDLLKDNSQIKNITINGKYIIYTMNESEYEGKKLEDFKTSYSFLVPVYKD